MPRYRSAGVDIESVLRLPGLRPTRATAGAADLVVRVGEVAPALSDALERGANWELAADVLRVEAPGLARFLIRQAGEIVVAPEPGVDPDDLAIFISGPMLGLFLHLRGRIVLQASAVAVDGGAVLFCGETGTGKSTLAATLGERGYPILCDDLCVIETAADGALTAIGDSTTLKLWADTVRRLGLKASAPVRATLQKHHVRPAAGAIAAAPVRSVYVVRETRPSDKAGIVRPNVVDQTIFVERSAYRPRIVRALAQKGAYLAAAAQLASRAGVFMLSRELGFAQMDRVLDELEAHWAETATAPDKAA